MSSTEYEEENFHHGSHLMNTLFQDDYVRSLGLYTVKDFDDSPFYVIVGEVLPTQRMENCTSSVSFLIVEVQCTLHFVNVKGC